MQKTCDFKDPGAAKICGADAMWVADVSWIPDASSAPEYKGTSWSVALCERHYQELLDGGRITGTARRA
jgi:hypothetical protein